MKKITVLFVLSALLLLLVSCFSRDEGYDIGRALERPFCATVSGKLCGVEISAQLVAQGGRDGDFYIRYLSGSLSEMIVDRTDGKLSISRGGIEDTGRDGYRLFLIFQLLFFDEASLLRREVRNGESLAVFSARRGETRYEMIARGGGIPLTVSVDKGTYFVIEKLEFI